MNAKHKNNTLQNDLFVFNLCYKIGAVLAMFPWNFFSSKIFYQTMVFGVVVCASWILVIFFVTRRTMITLDAIIFNAVSRVLCPLYLTITFRALIINRKRWKLCFKLISSLNKRLGKHIVSKKISIAKVLILVAILTSFIFYYMTYIPSFQVMNIIGFMFWFLLHLEITITSIMLLEISLFIQKKQVLLVEKLGNIDVAKFVLKINVVSTQYRYTNFPKNREEANSKANVLRDIKVIECSYKNICTIVEHIDSVFSLNILLIVCIFCLTLINYTIFILEIAYRKRIVNTRRPINDGIFLTAFLIFIILIAVAGDKMEKSFLNTSQMFQIWQTNIKVPWYRDRTRKVSNVFKKVRPALTVSGFLNVNRTLLPILLSSITSYIIILIQFKIN